jgi:hypothetical protein
MIVEIYTSLAALAGGRSVGRTKMKTGAVLDAALVHIGSAATGITGSIDDHKSDAILTAAWLRSIAEQPALWHPPAMIPEIAVTEGWTFGIA